MRDPEEVIRGLEKKLENTETRLFDIEERYRHLVEGTHGLICTHDMDGVLLSINPAACRALGYEMSELVGHSLRDFLSPSRRDLFHLFLDRINRYEVDKGILLLETRDGRELTFQYHNIKITRNVEKPYVIGHAYDITELKTLQTQLEELTVTDDLTGLNNRRGFMARAADLMARARREGETLMLIFADVDGLKKINDIHGHAFGSQVIMDAAAILRDSFRQTDVISRWGGDEFVILLGKSTESSPEVVTGRVLKKIAAFNARSDRPYVLSLSLGLAPVDLESENSLDDIIAEADKEMYKNKRSKPGS